MKTRDMTKGDLFREIIFFALPVALGLLFQQLYNLADTVIVGRLLGVNALAGVGSTTGLTFLAFSLSAGFGNGFAVSVSQRFGAGDTAGVKRYFGNAILVTGILAVVLTLITVIFSGPVLTLTKTPDEIYPFSYGYVVIIFAGLSCTMFYNLFASVLRAIGDSRTPVIALVISSVINIVLDLILIRQAHMGVAGAALATVVSQFISAVFLFVYMMKKSGVLGISRSDLRISGDISKEQLKTSFPMALQGTVIAVGITIVQISINSMGTVYVAGTTAGNKLYGIMVAPIDALCQAMIPISAQNYGAKKFDRIGTGLRKVAGMGWTLTVILTVISYYAGPAMMKLFMDGTNAKVISYGHKYLLFYVCGYGFLTIQMSFCYTLQGCGFAGRTIWSGVLETMGRIFGASVLTGVLGYTGICLALPLAWVFTSVYLIPTYFVCRRRMEQKDDSSKRKFQEVTI